MRTRRTNRRGWSRVPLILLAIPSLADRLLHRRARCCSARLGWPREDAPYFIGAIEVLPEHDVLAKLAPKSSTARWRSRCTGSWRRRSGWRFAGFALATCLYLFRPDLPAQDRARCSRWPVRVLEQQVLASTTCGSTASPAAASRSARPRARRRGADRRHRRSTARARVVDRVVGLVRRCSPATCTTTPSR